jgi:hypothetical protein
MPPIKGVRLVLGLAVIWLFCLGIDTFGQGAAAFVPNIGSAPTGETMTVTPAVSADRRYVRLSVNGFFNTVNGFSSFTTPLGAVGGAGGLGGGGLGGGLGGIGGGLGGAGGFRSVGGFGAPGETFNAGMNGVIGPAGFDGGMGYDPGAYYAQIGVMGAGAFPLDDSGLGYGFRAATIPAGTRSIDVRYVTRRARPNNSASAADPSPRHTTADAVTSAPVESAPAIPKAVARHQKARAAHAAKLKKASDEEPVIKPKSATKPDPSE